jgi:hypothetical protein
MAPSATALTADTPIRRRQGRRLWRARRSKSTYSRGRPWITHVIRPCTLCAVGARLVTLSQFEHHRNLTLPI